MNTEKINILSENEGNEKSEDKSVKGKTGKKVAGKAAQFAGAAGVGAAATLAANAMDISDENETDSVAVVNETPAENHLHEQIAEPIAGEPVEFDPNDIMIEEIEEVDEISDGNALSDTTEEQSLENDNIASDDLQPLTVENAVEFQQEIAVSDIVEPDSDPTDIVIEELPDDFIFDMSGDPVDDNEEGFVDATGDIDFTTGDIMDNEDVLTDPDILGDILDA